MTSLIDPPCGRLMGNDEGGVTVFRGVPYAAPPTGALRFAPPVPLPAWPGTRDATKDGPIAPQAPSRLRDAMGDFSAPQDEDCLTLTIWTPDAAGPHPVLVWLHGGAWSSGAGSLPWYDGGVLAREQKIIVVGVNYRLGALGYLHAPGISPGNLGSLDQIAALRWVAENIAAFGGDPTCVTVGGQSAGAATIGRLIADPAARPLFRRAILQSGGFGRAPLSRAQAAAIGKDYVRLLGIEPGEPDAAARMQAVPVARLIEASGALARSRARFADTTAPFMPLVEGELSRDALIGMIADAADGLEVMIGTTRDEVHAFYAANPTMQEPSADAVAEVFARSSASIARFRARRPGAAAMDLLADLATEQNFTGPSMRLAESLAARGVPVFAYQFDWAPTVSRFQACHCVELPFMFGTLPAWREAPMLAGGEPAGMTALSGLMRDHWGGFIRDGRPGADWPRYERDGRRTMIFGEVCGPVGDPAGLGWRA